MIPEAFITEWRFNAPWPSDSQVEQDLIISRAIIEIFSDKQLHNALAFRGGTALHKLHIKDAVRYSEDIDLVQVKAEKAGPTIDLLRNRLDPWLGAPSRKFTEGSVKLVYKVKTESNPPTDLKLKIEINSRDHFTILGHLDKRFSLDSQWFQGAAAVKTFELEELLATKLRALYQRKKGRDLLDLWLAISNFDLDLTKLVRCFNEYVARQGLKISRSDFINNLTLKMSDSKFLSDTAPILADTFSWDVNDAYQAVESDIFPLLAD